jgi:hypothetical protein
VNPRVLEQYKFYRLCEHDFDMAIHTLKILRRYKRSDVRNALLRDITVAYAKPFSTNRGALSQHSLSLKHVPLPMRGLHKELIDLRNQLFAHTDLTFKNPKVANWSSGKHKWFPMSFRGFDYNNLNKRVNEISNLIYSVQNELLKKIKGIENSI